MSTLREQLKHQVEGERNGLELRKLIPDNVTADPDGHKVQLVRFGPEQEQTGVSTFSLLLLGETGAGKTTFINAFVNHIFGVEFSDSFRLQVQDYGSETKTSTAFSQTEYITVYHFTYREGMRYRASFQVIDTPGYNSTEQSSVSDEDITPLLSVFLSQGFGVNQLHCVGIVMNGTVCRLTQNVHKVIEAITSGLACNTLDNVMVLATRTYATDTPDGLTEILQEMNVGYSETKKFENKALYVKIPECRASEDWSDMCSSYESFIEAVERSEPVSLRHMQQLNTMLEELRGEEGKLLMIMKKKQQVSHLNQQENEIILQIKDLEEDFVEEDITQGKHVHYCKICLLTCSEECSFSFLAELAGALEDCWEEFKNAVGYVTGISKQILQKFLIMFHRSRNQNVLDDEVIFKKFCEDNDTQPNALWKNLIKLYSIFSGASIGVVAGSGAVLLAEAGFVATYAVPATAGSVCALATAFMVSLSERITQEDDNKKTCNFTKNGCQQNSCGHEHSIHSVEYKMKNIRNPKEIMYLNRQLDTIGMEKIQHQHECKDEKIKMQATEIHTKVREINDLSFGINRQSLHGVIKRLSRDQTPLVRQELQWLVDKTRGTTENLFIWVP